MSAADGYKGFVLGLFISGVVLGLGAIAAPASNNYAPATTPLGVMIGIFTAAGLMAGMYMLWFEKALS